MKNYRNFLAELDTYPCLDQIAEASEYAREIALKYAQSLDESVDVNIEEGETYVTFSDDFDDENGEFAQNVQITFDEAFSEKIEELQRGI